MRGRSLLLGCVVLTTAVRAEPERAFYSPRFLHSCNMAIERAKETLRRIQGEDGVWMHASQNTGHPIGNTALALHALVRSGVSLEDAAVRSGLKAIDKLYDEHYEQAGIKVADVAMHLALECAIESPLAGSEVCHLGRSIADVRRSTSGARTLSREDRRRIRQHAAYIVEAQQENGLWYYTNERGRTRRAPKESLPEGGFSFKSADLVNTHLALMALQAATRSQAKARVPRRVWHQAIAGLLDLQEPENPEAKEVEFSLWGWDVNEDVPAPLESGSARPRGFRYCTYQPRASPTVSTTFAAAHCLRICIDEGGKHDLAGAARHALQGALAWLETRGDLVFDAAAYRERKLEGHYMYVLFTADRFFTSEGVVWFGDRDWYRFVAQAILDRERKDNPGVWFGGTTPGRYSESIETSMALLILRRSPTAIPPASD